MGVGVCEATASQNEVCFREVAGEHLHEGDRATAANVDRFVSEDFARRFVNLGLDVTWKVRGRETGSKANLGELDLSAVGFIVLGGKGLL